MDIGDHSDVNSGKPWSEIDLCDLADCLSLNQSVEEIATFLCRSRDEVRDKIAEQEQSGELAKRAPEVVADPPRASD
jgi:hypothetical protein